MPRRLRRLTGDERRQVAAACRQLYEQERASIRSLAARFDLSYGLVHTLLLQAGTQLRARSGPAQPMTPRTATPKETMTTPAHPKLSARALIRSEHGHILMVRGCWPSRWRMPGGDPTQGEAVSDACRRTVMDTLGLDVTPGWLLTVHHLVPDGAEGGAISFVFDCGTTPAASAIVPSTDFIEHAWVPPANLTDWVAPYIRWRIREALDVADDAAGISYLVGHAPQAPPPDPAE